MAQVIGMTMRAVEKWRVEPLKRALDYAGEMDVDDVCQRIREGKAQLWLVQAPGSEEVYASALTELVEYPKMTAVRVIALEGVGLVRWQEALMRTLFGFARQHGARRVEAICRPGLEKMLRPIGATKRFVCLYKEVPENGQYGGNG